MQTVLDELNLYIRENEFLTLLGPSGCGKTTTLRILGGFETPDKGRVIFDGQDITNFPANKRQLNTVFQKYALFTHMNIAENIAFGLKIKNKSKQYIYDKIKYALKLGDGPLTNGLENVHFVHNCLPELKPAGYSPFLTVRRHFLFISVFNQRRYRRGRRCYGN